MTVRSSGYDDVTYTYDYEEPIIHSIGKFLVGYRTTQKESPFLRELVEFHNDDDVAGLLLSSLRVDDRTAAAVQFADHTYDESIFEGLRWLRPQGKQSGWRSRVDATEKREIVTYAAYDRGLCPTEIQTTTAAGTLVQELVLAEIPELEGYLHCLHSHERLTGTHADASKDFAMEREVVRNERGQITRLVQHGDDGALTLQTASYDELHRVVAVSQPGRGTTRVTYDENTGLLHSVTAPHGVETRASERDPTTDAYPISFAVEFDETVSGLEFADLTFENGTAAADDLSVVAAGQSYTIVVTPTAEDAVSVTVAVSSPSLPSLTV